MILDKMREVLSTESYSERGQLRKKRKKKIEKHRKRVSSGRILVKPLMEELIELSMKEARYTDGFDPDLLIVTRDQYLVLFDIPASVGIGQARVPRTPMGGYVDFEPPIPYTSQNGKIEVTYSNSADGMLLVESEAL